MNRIEYDKVAALVIFAVLVWVFWAFVHPEALVYQEQLQMFLFDKEYLMERVLWPGGVARYVAEFLGQFYNNLYIGAAVLAVLYLLIHQLVHVAARPHCKSRAVCFFLSFVPVIVLWYAMGDENIKLTFVIALIFALVAMSAYPYAESKTCKLVYLAVSVPLLFWLAGPTLLMFIAYVIMCECVIYKEGLAKIYWQPLLYTAFFFTLGMAIVPCPAYRLFYGINYHIHINEFPTLIYLVMVVCLLTVLLVHYVPEFKFKRTERKVVIGLGCAIIVAAFAIVPLNFNNFKYDVFEYDYLVRAMKWEKIVEKAEKTEAKSPLSAASYNLALGKLGQMDRAMQFRQNGWSGAFPPFSKNYLASLMTSEVYWHLGLVNTAQRFMFEAMETIPDNNKSSRIIRRLAETNLVNGQYEVARKYLLLLQKTMFYHKWATETMALLGNEEAIDSHPVYGFLRNARLTEDFLFSEPEIDKIVGQLVRKNADNNLAIGYLLLLPQLEGNQKKYMMYLDYVNWRKTQGVILNDSIVNDSIKED